MAEEKKINAIDDEALDNVTGGVIPEEEWNNMTDAEKKAAQDDSLIKKLMGEVCPLD